MNFGKVKAVCSSCSKEKYESNPIILGRMCSKHNLIDCQSNCRKDIIIIDKCTHCNNSHSMFLENINKKSKYIIEGSNYLQEQINKIN